MNDPELERRFRSVTEGPQPAAPQSLRRFLAELPEAKPDARVRLGRLWQVVAKSVRVSAAAGAVGLAVVAGLVAGNLLIGIHRSDAPGPTTPVTLSAGGFDWTGTAVSGALVPDVAITGGADGYLGVGRSPGGRGALLTSSDGLHWSDRGEAAIDPKSVDLHAVARGEKGYVAVGESVGLASGASASEPRFFYSRDGSTWQESSVADSLKGAPARTVVASPTGFLAAGWNATGSGGPGGTWLWASSDGIEWTGGRSETAIDGPAFIAWTGDGYLASGRTAPGPPGSGLLPIFLSKDGVGSWMQTSGEDSLSEMGPAIASVLPAADGKLRLLVWSTVADEARPDGKTRLVLADAGVFMQVPGAAPDPPDDLRSLALVGDRTLLASSAGGRIYSSPDGGVSWRPLDFGAAPLHPGTGMLEDLGNGKYLLLGSDSVWLVTPRPVPGQP